MNRVISRLLSAALFLASMDAAAQPAVLTDTRKSPYAKLQSVGIESVRWNGGFWGERFAVMRDSMVPNLHAMYMNDGLSHAFKNFRIAAGIDTGSHKGPSFHDGDFYKMLESVAALRAATADTRLDRWLDEAIQVVGLSQRNDGYIYTKSVIDQKKTGAKTQFESRLSFEAYNIGHLMTAACLHQRATGKTSLMNIAVRAADYLYRFYDTASAEVARNAICPSHYMGLVELYRSTGDARYRALAGKLIDIRGKAPGSDDNSDRYAFRDMKQVQGHAVRANYLFAGAADFFAETGDTTLLRALDRMWDDVTNHKMYITGGCGALYDGVSNDGTSYDPGDVEKLHQAYGRKYQLPNFTAHNETCANIGNLLWNWRMLQVTGDAKYTDVLELALYNSILSGISVDGKKFLYTNPLAYSNALPFQQRWSKERVPYISLSNCCPPNVVRTLAEVAGYAYGASDRGIYVHLYGENELRTEWKREPVVLRQRTDYPWNGTVRLVMDTMPMTASLFVRIPGWARSATIMVNGVRQKIQTTPGTYAELRRKQWKKGDVVTLELPMPAELIEANPMVEETRGQAAVKRGPIVYCIESAGVPDGQTIWDLEVPESARFTSETMRISTATVTALKTNVQVRGRGNWKDGLYRTIQPSPGKNVEVRLIPYFAWGNRGLGEMNVWMPLR